jgi:hypothetical protein
MDLFRSLKRAGQAVGLTAVVAMIAPTVSSASPSGYVYVAVPAAACAQPSPCAPPQVLVIDAATAEIATRIDLPANTVPQSLTFSSDGTRLYVWNVGAEFGSSSMTVIDPRHNVPLNTFSVPWSGSLTFAFGPAASQLVALVSGTLYVIDATTGEHLRSVSVSGFPSQVGVSKSLNRIFVGGSNNAVNPGTIYAYDADTLAQVGQYSSGLTILGFTVSGDGRLLYVRETNFARPSNGLFGRTVDALTLAVVGSFDPNPPSSPNTLPRIEVRPGEFISVGRGDGYGIVSRSFSSGTGGSSAQFPTLPNLSSFAVTPPDDRVFALHYSTGATTSNLLAVIDTKPIALVKTIPLSQTASLITRTLEGAASCTYAVNRTYVPLARTTPTATVSLTTDCGWTASTSDSWIHLSHTAGSGNATLTLTLDLNQGGSPREGTVIVGGQAILVRQAGFAFQPPFGVMDTPADGAAVQGSIAVTGWALDDLGVQRVEIWRDLQPGETTVPFSSTASDPRHGKVFIANGTFVDGARPDIATLYPLSPLRFRAGWGYLLLTWGLWNQGSGAYKLSAYAIDEESNIALIGSKTMVVNNLAANKPFGAIDTPGIGAEASGPNFGWALTPRVNGAATCRIPASGVQVSIDSGPLQPVVYGTARSDVAGTFQGMSNSSAAGGHFIFDWSTLTNGPHTIGWLVTDDCGRSEGIGSRFFNVTSGTTAGSQTAQARALEAPGGMLGAIGRERESAEPVLVRRGDGELEQQVSAESGVRLVDVQPGQRMQIRLPHGYTEAYQVVSRSQRRSLPIGSTWDPASGTFYWQPAPGFLGSFVITFSNGPQRISVRVQITP